MAETLRQYTKRVLVEGGMNDAEAESQIVKAETKNPTLVGTTLYDSNEWQGMNGRVQAAARERDEIRARADEYFNTHRSSYDGMVARLAELEGGRTGIDGAPTSIDTSQFVTKADFIKQQEEQRARTAIALKGVSSVGIRHFKNFGEELDIEALDKFMTEARIFDPSQGYEAYIQPRISKKKEEEFDIRLKKAVEDARREERSRSGLPADPVPREISPFESASRPKSNGTGSNNTAEALSDLDTTLLDTWNKTATAGANR